MRNSLARLVVIASILLAKPAFAAFHLMKIVQVFPGTAAAPNAQYIQLQMYASGQNQVTGHKVTIFDASGATVTSSTFQNIVNNQANQSTILIATTEAAILFGVTADLAINPGIALAGGKVCFDAIDCVAWGNYSGMATGVGQPAFQNKGLIIGRALVRRIDKGGMPTTLDAVDDSDISADDFVLGAPAPKTNAGVNGTLPPSTCGNGTMEGLESCDDNNTTANDGCSDQCVTEQCGDGVVQTTEQCDDTNSNDGDACSNACMTQSSTDDVPPADDAGITPGDDDGGGGGCCQTGHTGAAPVLALLVLGLIVRRRRRC